MKHNLTANLERRFVTGPAAPVKLRKNPKRRGAYRDDGDTDADAGTSTDAETGNADDVADGPGTITGYAAVFYSEADPGTEYELYSDRDYRIVERLDPGCFRDAMDRPDDVRSTFNHDDSQLLGRTSAGTCRLSIDSRGLRYDTDLPDTTTGRDVAELIDRGDVTGSSFGFLADRDSWQEIREEGQPTLAIRTLESVRLLDAGPVTYPAYSSTSTGRGDRSATGTVRALGSVEEARASYERWKAKRAADAPLAAKLAAVRLRVAQAEMEMAGEV